MRKGQKYTHEQSAKLSEALKASWTKRGGHHSSETKVRIGKSQQALWQSAKGRAILAARKPRNALPECIDRREYVLLRLKGYNREEALEILLR